MNTSADYAILIVDDQVANLDVLSDLLESRGFNILVARDGAAALDIVQRVPPDLILLDVILPGMDGFEICRQLKAGKQTAQIPVIFMTVLEKIEDKVQGFQLGAADYITKPFQVEEVLARVTTQLRLRSLTRELQAANETLEHRVAERTAQLAQMNQDLQTEVVKRRSVEATLGQANEALTRMNRAYHMLSECNQIVVYATEEAKFLQAICQTIVVRGDYFRACIDLVELDETHSLRPVAQAKVEENHLGQTPMIWPEEDQGRFFSAAVVHTGEPVIYQDIFSDPYWVSLQTDALKPGYGSAAAFPLQTGEQETIGVLTVYAVPANAFSKEEIRLFMELATDMAFGVITLRTRTERQQAEDARRESEARWRSLTETSPDHIVTLDQDLNIEFVNHASPGLIVEGLIGTPLYTYVDEDRQAEIKALHEQVLKTGVSASYETEYAPPEGSVIYYESRAVPRRLNGEVIGLTVSARDITARKQVEQERLSHLRFLESMDMVSRAIQGTNDLEQMMNDVLDAVLSIFDCDRAFLLYPCDPEADTWQVPVERTKPEYPGALTLGLEIPMDADVAASLRILRESDRPVKFGPGTNYPLPAEVSAQFGFKTFMSMALYPKIDKPWQFGIHQCAYPRMWTKAEERLLQEIGQRLADALTSLLAYRQVQEREQALQQSNNLLQTIIEAAPVAIIGLDLDGNVQLVWNPAAEQMLGWSASEVMGHSLPSVPVESQAEFERFREQIRRGLTLDGVEVRRQRRDGTPIDYSIYASPLHDSAGHIMGNIAVLVDITERKRTDAELRKLSRAVEQSPASVVITDTTGHIEYVNPKFTQLAGYTLDEVLGQNPRILKSGHTPPEEYALLWDTITAGREWRGEFLNKKKNGECYWEIASISPIRDATETITHFIAVKEDITERKRAEEALQAQYATLRGIIDSTHALIFSVDRQYHYTSFNQRHAAVMQALYGAEIELGHSLLDYMTVTEDRATAKRNIDCALAGEQLVEEAYSGEEPHSRYFHVSHSPIQAETGDIIGVAVLAQDITERRWAEEALHESEKRFRLLAENSTDMISLHAPDGTYLYVSPASKPLLGYEPGELVGQSAYALFHPADVAAIRQSHATIIDHPMAYTVQYRIRRKTGDYIWFETTSKTIRDSPNEVVQEIQAASRDITARKQAEAAEREQRLLATALAKTAAAINSTLDFDEVLERLLDAIKDVVPHDGANIMLLDESRTALAVVCSCDCYQANGLEKPDADIWPLTQSPHLQQMIDTHEALLIPHTLEYVGWSMKTNSNLIHAYLGIPIIVEGEVIGILNIDSITPDFFTEQHVDRLQGFAHQAAIALRNAQLFQQLASYNADLEQAVIERTLELTRANTELRQLSRIKDEFVSNVSHELKSPITTLMLRHHLLRKHPEDFAKHLDVLERETTRLGRTIEDLLRLSRLDQGRIAMKLAPVDLNVMVECLVYDRSLHAQHKELSLTFVGQPDLSIIMADQGLLEQVLSILLTNAIHYTPPAGQISVFTQAELVDAAHWVGFGVRDTGLGIPLEEQSRLFERFFQGEANRQSGVPGTGLGLAIAKEIVDRHHGRIEVESTGIPGEGATFKVWLPRVAEEPDIPTRRH